MACPETRVRSVSSPKVRESGRDVRPDVQQRSIDEMDDAYDLRFRYFETREDLIDQLVTFVESSVVPLHSVG
jgi:hypothetical protein